MTALSRLLQRRTGKGVYGNLLQEIRLEDPESFRQYHRLDRESFERVLETVGPSIRKVDTSMRTSISPGERLAITLRFLATGETFRSLAFQFRIGERTVSNIVDETCQALYSTMKEQYMRVPTTTEEWMEIAMEFNERWNYPCCIGAIDGKHIAIQQPENSGSEYFNYKHFFSVVLLALVNANYKFIYVDVGAAGRAGDAGIFANSALKKALSENSLNLPPAEEIDGISPSKINYHIVGDDAFPLSLKLMKPYPHRNLDQPKQIFNYRLSRARRVVENAFGILSNRFRVFLTTINLRPDKVQHVILAACCLHNYMVENNKIAYISICDSEDTNHTLTAGLWRKDHPLTGQQPTTDRNPKVDAKLQRQLLTEYFNSDCGAVPWQNDIFSK
ncbi:putative nuclease HARBI1 [Melanotaenia boesemani]|uniref:putative nuclease HARBI1 n=1 Tax=Melanotaenia boesemani TaxID=1250792 RepID=UPI001C04EC6E|nr:putative nuclease HARBI1 [Melanotaenia boesemani]